MNQNPSYIRPSRYTLTYTPSQDRIVPTAPHLAVKIRNTSTVALRAAYLHGPYTLYVACYSATFDPNQPHGDPDTYGHPHFEPNLKAGGTWNAQLKVPEDIRETFAATEKRRHSQQQGGSATWIIEITSQVLFSTNASVQFELLVGRDEKSIDLGFAGLSGVAHAAPGTLHDFQDRRKDTRPGVAQSKGVYSKAIQLLVSDTAALWNTPQLPGADQERKDRENLRTNPVLDDAANPASPTAENITEAEAEKLKSRKTRNKNDRQKIHLVIITHGLHSNLGADMLYLKESIDAAAKQARLDRKMRMAQQGEHASRTGPNKTKNQEGGDSSTAPLSGGQEDIDHSDHLEKDTDEQVVVRGFPGNAAQTEKGIKYLGKRLAKYVLAMTYPDQPYIPIKKKSMTHTLTNAFGGGDKTPRPGKGGDETHHRSTISKKPVEETTLAYQITSISFIGHSLGGLVQTYAVAYIQKHSPEFFELIRPINFIALASPFLGLSNENPLYVKFALDFGLVGRTGQDLGLTWRAPTVVRNGWGAMIAGIGSEGQRKRSQPDPGSKPLLRILPAGPAHQVLRLFRNRTVYSNVVNDGIVPLRTSCLLFLDWRGLGRVDKARRENGLVGTMAGWGWAELTGQNSSEQRSHHVKPGVNEAENSEGDDDMAETRDAGSDSPGNTVPQPEEEDIDDHLNVSAPTTPMDERRFNERQKRSEGETRPKHSRSNSDSGPSPFAGFLALLRPGGGSKSKSSEREPKSNRIYKRSQTVKFEDDSAANSSSNNNTPTDSQTNTPRARSPNPRPGMARGDSALQDDSVIAPPKTSVFESAGDLLNPPLPTRDFISNPLGRPRTVFHDRVYHPEDIPPPPMRMRSFLRRSSSYEARTPTSTSMDTTDSTASSSTEGTRSAMKVEEKIARAYHRDLSWRKVLVRLEPDAHNNIVVRRMFANAYGWPVIKHLVDTHFADSMAARMADTNEAGEDRAKPMHSVRDGVEVTEAKPRESVETTGHGTTDAPAGSGLGLAALHLDRAGPEASANGSDGTVTKPGKEPSPVSETRDSVAPLPNLSSASQHSSIGSSGRHGSILSRQDSAQWDDRVFDTDDDDEDDDDVNAFAATRSPRHIAMEGMAALVGASPPMSPMSPISGTASALASDDQKRPLSGGNADTGAAGTAPAGMRGFSAVQFKGRVPSSDKTLEARRAQLPQSGGGSNDAVAEPNDAGKTANASDAGLHLDMRALQNAIVPGLADAGSGSAAELGLRKSVEEQISPRSGGGRTE